MEKRQGNNIILIGMPASGKTTCGKRLARQLDMAFIDTDIVLISRNGDKPLREIIARYGKEKFLQLEAEAVRSIDAFNAVISTGGSVVYQEDAMRHLQKLGIIIYLKADIGDIEKRVANPEQRGVAMENSQSMMELYQERHPLYEKYADYIIDCRGIRHNQIVSHIISLLQAK